MHASIPHHCQRILRALLICGLFALGPGQVWAQAAPSEPAPAKLSPSKEPDVPGVEVPEGEPSPTPAGAPGDATPAAPSPEPTEASSEPTKASSEPTEADRAAAKEAMERGLEAYRSGDYVTAAAHFAASRQLAWSAEAQFYYAMSLDLQGKATEAVDAFGELFANPAHTSLAPEQLEPAKKRYELLQTIPATVVLYLTPPDAQLTVDGTAQTGTSPYTLKLSGGTHRLTISQEGFEPLTTDLTVKPAQSSEQALELKALPPPVAPEVKSAAAPPPPPREPRSRVPAYVTLGVAGAGAVVGTIFGIQALSAKNDFEDNRTTDNADEVERNALIADMAFGVAITLGITGIVLLTTDEPIETGQRNAQQVSKNRLRRPTLQVAPYFSPDGAGAAARATF